MRVKPSELLTKFISKQTFACCIAKLTQQTDKYRPLMLKVTGVGSEN